MFIQFVPTLIIQSRFCSSNFQIELKIQMCLSTGISMMHTHLLVSLNIFYPQLLSMLGGLYRWFPLSFDVLLLCPCARMERSGDPWDHWYVLLIPQIASIYNIGNFILFRVPIHLVGVIFVFHSQQNLLNLDLAYYQFLSTTSFSDHCMHTKCLMFNHFAGPDKTKTSPPPSQYMES